MTLTCVINRVTIIIMVLVHALVLGTEVLVLEIKSLKMSCQLMLFMVDLWNRADHYIFMLWFLSIFFFFFLA